MKSGLSEQELEGILSQVLWDTFNGKNFVHGEKTFYILSGTPGSGKTRLRDKLFKDYSLEKNTVLANTDDLRAYHPDYRLYLVEDPITAPIKVNDAAVHWSNELQRTASEKDLNVMLDTTFGRSYEGSRQLLVHYKERGYRVEMHSLVISPHISRLGNYLRYLEGFERGYPERLVGVRTMEQNVKMIPLNLERLSKDDICDQLRFYSRVVYEENGRLLNNRVEEIPSPKDLKKYNVALWGEHQRNKPFTADEAKHYRNKYDLVIALAERHCPKLLPECRRELEGLRMQIKEPRQGKGYSMLV